MEAVGEQRMTSMTHSLRQLAPLHGTVETLMHYNDSIATGSINAIEVPYRIVIRNFDLIPDQATQMVRDFVDLILEISERGCPVEVELRDSSGMLLPVQHSRPQN
jgi:hypothetical protein